LLGGGILLAWVAYVVVLILVGTVTRHKPDRYGWLPLVAAICFVGATNFFVGVKLRHVFLAPDEKKKVSG